MAQDFEAQKKNKIASPYTSQRDLWDKTQNQIYISHQSWHVLKCLYFPEVKQQNLIPKVTVLSVVPLEGDGAMTGGPLWMERMFLHHFHLMNKKETPLWTRKQASVDSAPVGALV